MRKFVLLLALAGSVSACAASSASAGRDALNQMAADYKASLKTADACFATKGKPACEAEGAMATSAYNQYVTAMRRGDRSAPSVAWDQYKSSEANVRACLAAKGNSQDCAVYQVMADADRALIAVAEQATKDRAPAAPVVVQRSPDYNGMLAIGAAMMQAGQPQYQPPINVYVTQPATPYAHMPTGRW